MDYRPFAESWVRVNPELWMVTLAAHLHAYGDLTQDRFPESLETMYCSLQEADPNATHFDITVNSRLYRLEGTVGYDELGPNTFTYHNLYYIPAPQTCRNKTRHIRIVDVLGNNKYDRGETTGIKLLPQHFPQTPQYIGIAWWELQWSMPQESQFDDYNYWHNPYSPYSTNWSKDASVFTPAWNEYYVHGEQPEDSKLADVACDHTTPSHELVKLVEHSDPAVATIAAHNPACPDWAKVQYALTHSIH